MPGIDLIAHDAGGQLHFDKAQFLALLAQIIMGIVVIISMFIGMHILMVLIHFINNRLVLIFKMLGLIQLIADGIDLSMSGLNSVVNIDPFLVLDHASGAIGAHQWIGFALLADLIEVVL